MSAKTTIQRLSRAMQDIVLGVAFLSVITDTPSTGATIKQFLNTQEQNNKIKPE